MNLMSLIYCFDLLESECSILKVNFRRNIKYLNLKTIVKTESGVTEAGFQIDESFESFDQ